ncbi:MAG TPA: zinc-binding dehydrogenase [Gemmatimonadales bacterium]|nr:zinc-binding dehydrogenase [Gemmatimonadales bacterium]
MKAAVFHGNGTDLKIEDWPLPEPRAGEVVIRVAACGLCHTDLHYLDHGVSTFKTPPIVLGHEAAGTIARIGAEVSGVAEGDRVLAPSVWSCGRCRFCREGRENLCINLVMPGNHTDGAFAEFLAVPAKELVPLPPTIPLERACIIADAVSTPYHAVKRRGHVRAGDTVAVVGCGGVGLNVVQCAAVAGATVVAVDLNDARLELAQRLGARYAINAATTERVDKQVRTLTSGGVDVAFEVVGNPKTIDLAFNLIRKGGRLVVIGFSHEMVSINAGKLMFYELELVGSLGCGAGEYPEIVALVESGRLTLDPIVSGTFPLERINEGFDRLRRGEGVRWVVTP